MGRDLAAEFVVARRTFEEADDRLGVALSRLCFEGPEETLRLTANAQPAILTASVAAYRALEEVTGLEPAAVAGHSLGEWSALVAAGALGLGDAVVGVRERGRLMQEAVPPGEGAMAAILGLDADAVAALCAEAAEADVLVPANLNGGGQVVVAGHARAVDRLLPLAALGATLALETGPGRVLSGLSRRIAPALVSVPAGDVDGIARAREVLGA